MEGVQKVCGRSDWLWWGPLANEIHFRCTEGAREVHGRCVGGAQKV